jgi:hypothetical protein
MRPHVVDVPIVHGVCAIWVMLPTRQADPGFGLHMLRYKMRLPSNITVLNRERGLEVAVQAECREAILRRVWFQDDAFLQLD